MSAKRSACSGDTSAGASSPRSARRRILCSSSPEDSAESSDFSELEGARPSAAAPPKILTEAGGATAAAEAVVLSVNTARSMEPVGGPRGLGSARDLRVVSEASGANRVGSAGGVFLGVVAGVVGAGDALGAVVVEVSRGFFF